jgi:hypothetical protein
MVFSNEIKGACSGASSTIGRIGGIFAPMTVELPEPIPLIAFSGACFFGFLVILVGMRKKEKQESTTLVYTTTVKGD